MIQRLSQRVRQFLPLLLGATYLIALVLPWPGQQLHAWSLPEGLPEALRPRLPHLLVAILLFLAALGVDARRVRIVAKFPGLMLSVLAASWLTPLIVVLLASWLLPLAASNEAASSLLVGLALVAAMPVANSSVAWTQQSRGELSWSLSIVVLSIVVCPWTIPLVLQLLGLSFTKLEAAKLEELTNSLAGIKFVLWVLLPTAAGVVVRWLVGEESVTRHRQAVLLSSASSLLILNYINAAESLPKMQNEFRISWLLASIVAALAMIGVGLAFARLLGRLFRIGTPAIIALDYSLTMRNTGLALALATDVLSKQPILLLPVFTTTLVQHLFAAGLHRQRMQAADSSSGSG